MEQEKQFTGRSSVIDALRGIAVGAMILAHSLFFLHDGSNTILNSIQGILNITVFTVFLFVSGLATSRWLDKLTNTPITEKIRNIFIKTITLYAGYSMVAIVAIFSGDTVSVPDISKKLISALLLLNPPNFTEYFVLFIVLTVLLFPLFGLLKKIQHSVTLVVIVSVISYCVGLLLYSIHFSPPLNEMKLMFAGGDNALRFPVLFYFPVFIVGIWWQKSIDRKEPLSVIKLILGFILSITIILVSNVWTRWPPSVGNIALGISVAITLSLILPLLEYSFLSPVYQFITILGRHSLDLWIVHMLLLFGYQKLITVQYSDPFIVLLGIFSLISLCIAISTLTVRWQPSYIRVGPFGLLPHRRKFAYPQYLFFFVLLILIVAIPLIKQPSNSIYGDVMPTPALLVKSNDYTGITTELSTDRKWYIKKGTRSDTIQVSLLFTKDKLNINNIDLKDIDVFLDDQRVNAEKIQDVNGFVQLFISSSTLPPGSHTLLSKLNSGTTSIISNQKEIYITEPLYIAWTFDWEGWDVSDQTMEQITSFSKTYALPFTHYVSPRTFLPGVVPEKRKNELISFLLDRHTQGDELAMHLHMHFDFIKAAGVVPKKNNPWGLMTNEGYDIPTLDYSPEEFSKLVMYGKTLARNAGFPEMKGYRAGGWYINSALLNILEEQGFAYDSSGREKPPSGAFHAVPWNLQIDTTPYYPQVSDQNTKSPFPRKLMEIPNTGGSTYDLSTDNLITRITTVYNQKILTTPKVLVFVSHPQFSSREFSKIPVVLEYLEKISRDKDQGPVIFTTTSDIHDIWETLLP